MNAPLVFQPLLYTADTRVVFGAASRSARDSATDHAKDGGRAMNVLRRSRRLRALTLAVLALTMALGVATASASSKFRDCSGFVLAPGADLHRCDYSGSSAFQGQDIHGANLSKSSLILAHAGGDPDVPPANFTDVNLRHVVAWGADLSDTILINADLRRGDFSEASFEDATLMDALMSRGNFTSASFHFANLKGANLIRANLTGAAMTHTYLVNANLHHVKGLETAVGVDTAIFGNTICPDGRNSDHVGGTCIGHLNP